MFSKDVKTGNGNVKHVVALTKEELGEAVEAVKAEFTPAPPDINNPADANKIVSPDNRHTELPPVFE
jgi:hypothetical protein